MRVPTELALIKVQPGLERIGSIWPIEADQTIIGLKTELRVTNLVSLIQKNTGKSFVCKMHLHGDLRNQITTVDIALILNFATKFYEAWCPIDCAQA